MLDKLWELVSESLHSLVFWAVLDPYERGLQLRLGKLHKELGPGFHWILPLHIDRVISENVVPRVERLYGLSTTTADNKAVGFDAIVTYSISDVRKAMLEVDGLKDAISDACAGTIGTKLQAATWDEIRQGAPVDALTSACRRRGKKWGVEIESVQLAGIAIVRNLRLAVSAAPHVSVLGAS